MTGIADVATNKMKALRWYSTMNPELDCVVYVPRDKEDIARKTILAVMDKWCEESADLAYGDAIEIALDDAQVPYVLLLPEWNSDGMGCVEEWDDWADENAKSIV